MNILECLTLAPSLTMTEVAKSSNLTTSTTHRTLGNLVSHRLAKKDAESGKYSIGPRFLRIANAAVRNLDIASIATQHLVALRDFTNETSAVHIPTETLERLVVTQVESFQALRRTYTEIGQPVPIHEGAPGKVLLANLPPSVQETVLSRPLESATTKTVTEPTSLRGELARVRQDGVAVSIEERVPGVTSIAAPVFDFTSSVVAALSISGPSFRMTSERLQEFIPVLKETAQNITLDLGCEHANAVP